MKDGFNRGGITSWDKPLFSWCGQMLVTSLRTAGELIVDDLFGFPSAHRQQSCSVAKDAGRQIVALGCTHLYVTDCTALKSGSNGMHDGPTDEQHACLELLLTHQHTCAQEGQLNHLSRKKPWKRIKTCWSKGVFIQIYSTLLKNIYIYIKECNFKKRTIFFSWWFKLNKMYITFWFRESQSLFCVFHVFWGNVADVIKSFTDLWAIRFCQFSERQMLIAGIYEQPSTKTDRNSWW